MGRRSKISVQFMQHMLSKGLRREAWLFALMKSTEGECIRKELYDRRVLKSLRRMELVGYSPRTREYWQRSTEHAHKVLELNSCTYGYLTQRQLFKYEIDVLAYSLAYQYKLRLQEGDRIPQGKRGVKGRKRRKGKRRAHVQSSVHNGGISLSLMSAFFGFTDQWASRMRKKCASVGLLRFKRRWKPVKVGMKIGDGCDPPPEMDGHFDTHNGIGREITSKGTVRVRFEFGTFAWGRRPPRKFCPKAGIYV